MVGTCERARRIRRNRSAMSVSYRPFGAQVVGNSPRCSIASAAHEPAPALRYAPLAPLTGLHKPAQQSRLCGAGFSSHSIRHSSLAARRSLIAARQNAFKCSEFTVAVWCCPFGAQVVGNSPHLSRASAGLRQPSPFAIPVSPLIGGSTTPSLADILDRTAPPVSRRQHPEQLAIRTHVRITALRAPISARCSLSNLYSANSSQILFPCNSWRQTP